MAETLKERLERIYMQKEAGFWNAAKSVFTGDNLGRTIGGMGIAAAGTLAVSGGTLLGQKALEGIGERFMKPRHFKNMIDTNKNLQKNYKRDDVSKAFNALYALNPTYAKEPLVAGSMVGTMLNQPGFDESIPHVTPDLARTISRQDSRRPAGDAMVQQLMQVRPFDPGDVEHQRRLEMSETDFNRQKELQWDRETFQRNLEQMRGDTAKAIADKKIKTDVGIASKLRAHQQELEQQRRDENRNQASRNARLEQWKAELRENKPVGGSAVVAVGRPRFK